MASAAKRSFDRTLDRVLGLMSLHEPLHGSRGRPRQYVSDIMRSALVLAMAALDALVVDSVSEAVPALAKRGALGPIVAKWAKEDTERVVGFFGKANPHQELAELCREHLGKQTFQRSDAIEGILRDVLGAEPPWDGAASSLSSTWERIVTGEEVKGMLDEYVDRRNRIVHSGDAVPGKTATKPIQFDFVLRGGIVVEAVGEAIFKVVSDRIREVR
jgi:hypothetical protein